MLAFVQCLSLAVVKSNSGLCICLGKWQLGCGKNVCQATIFLPPPDWILWSVRPNEEPTQQWVNFVKIGTIVVIQGVFLFP